MSDIHYIITILRKDLLQEFRSKAVIVATVFFATIVLFILALALGPEQGILQRAAGGMLWTSLAFASVIASAQSYQNELQAGAWQQLLLYPLPRFTLYLGKLFANWLYLLLLAVLISGVVLLFLVGTLPLDGGFLFILTLLLGTLGLSIIATFYAALTANLRARESLLPVLMFPIIIPVLLATVRATNELLRSGALMVAADWLRFLAGFDLIYLLICALIFRFVVDE